MVAVEMGNNDCVELADIVISHELQGHHRVRAVAEHHHIRWPDDESAVSLADVEAVDADVLGRIRHGAASVQPSVPRWHR